MPRSISTAFEKMIWHAGTFEVISEPFLDMYKESLISERKYFEAKAAIRTMCDALLDQSLRRDIFVKDMGYHAEAFLSDSFIETAHHIFLTRDPQLSIPSLYKMRPDYGEDQPGFEGQLKLFERVKIQTGKIPLVIDAQQLTTSPETTVSRFFEHIDKPMPRNIFS